MATNFKSAIMSSMKESVPLRETRVGHAGLNSRVFFGLVATRTRAGALKKARTRGMADSRADRVTSVGRSRLALPLMVDKIFMMGLGGCASALEAYHASTATHFASSDAITPTGRASLGLDSPATRFFTALTATPCRMSARS